MHFASQLKKRWTTERCNWCGAGPVNLGESHHHFCGEIKQIWSPTNRKQGPCTWSLQAGYLPSKTAINPCEASKVVCTMFPQTKRSEGNRKGGKRKWERERGGGSRKKLTCSNAGQVGKMADHNQLIPKTIGNRKRDCAWGCAWGINTTWENLQIEKHKSVRWAERTPSWFVLFDLQIFSGGVYSPSATSRTISFSISNSFWY